jgi:predicted acylesterase/phospholipase RssA
MGTEALRGGCRAGVGLLALGLPALAWLVAGCAPPNRALNPLTLPLEQRAKNHTRAAIGAELVPLDARQPTRRIRPAARPAELAQAEPHAPDDHDGYFVGLAISGGGSRSANFAAAAMFQLQRLGMLQRVDYISSVSGGSLTAAYYCTHGTGGDGWNPENVQRKLSYGFASDSLGQTLLPWNTLGLMFTSLDRSDLLAQTFERVLFSRGGKALTYGDLRDDRPRLLINATDLQSGKPFIFSNESFDEFNSDLSKMPLAYAVAASSAVPVLLHQVTLQDYSTTFAQYRHLIDGGVSDNLGARTLVETFEAHVQQALARGETDPYPNGAVMIFLDATVPFDAKLSDQKDTDFVQSLVAGAGLSTTSLLNRAGTATLSEIIVQNAPDDSPARELRAQIRTLKDTGHLELKDRTGHPVRVVHIALQQVDQLTNVPFTSFRESVNNIATYFNIAPTEAFHLYEAADLIVKQKHESTLRQLLTDMDAGGRATTRTTAPSTMPAEQSP